MKTEDRKDPDVDQIHAQTRKGLGQVYMRYEDRNLSPLDLKRKCSV